MNSRATQIVELAGLLGEIGKLVEHRMLSHLPILKLKKVMQKFRSEIQTVHKCHIQYSPPIYESKFDVPTSDFTPREQTITKHVPPWSIRNQWSMDVNGVNTFFIH